MKNKNPGRLFINFFLFLCMICALRIPFIYDMHPELIKPLNLISIFSFVILIVLIKKISIRNFGFILFGYYILILFSSYRSNLQIPGLLFDFFLLVSPIIIFSCLPQKDFDSSLGTMLLAFEIVTYINFVTIILLPDGLYNVGFERKYFFLGHVNIAVRYLLPGTCLTIIYSLKKYGKISTRSLIYIICSILTLIITWPATSLVGYTIFLGTFILINKYKNISKILTPFNCFLFGLALTYLVVTIGIQSSFGNFITNYLHRDVTFTGRTLIWSSAIKYISYRPWLGYGKFGDTFKRLVFNGATSAHNEYLNILFEGGIIALVYVAIIFFILNKKIKKCTDQRIISVLAATVLSYTTMWVFLPFNYSGTFCMFLIFAIIYKSDTFFNKTGDELDAKCEKKLCV